MERWFQNICFAVASCILIAFCMPNQGKIMFPGLFCAIPREDTEKLSMEYVDTMFPLYRYVKRKMGASAQIEDVTTYEMILSKETYDEVVTKVDLTPTATQKVSIEKLRDFNYLLRNYYTVDSTTTIGAEQLNVDELLSKNMKINKQSNGPKVLIFHTHSQEAFADSKKGDTSTTIVGMGEYLTKLLNEKGIETIHHTGVYDLINGKLDRSKAYELSEEGVRKILKKYPSIEVVIDLHRDGVPESTHLVTDVNGKQTAKIMFFNGLSRTKTNGDIAYLKNPYIQDNLAFSLQMQLKAQEMYAGFTRKIYLKGYRYSLHMMPKSLLIEAGAQTNTVQETKNAMELLANILSKVLL